MKRIIVAVLLLGLCVVLCGCLKKTSSSIDNFDTGYDAGYEAGYNKGYEEGKEEAGDKLYSELSKAAEKVSKALGKLEDLPSKAYKIDGMDDVYDAVAKADDILSKYR